MGYDDCGGRTSLTSSSGRVSTMGYMNGLLSALSHAQNGVPLTDPMSDRDAHIEYDLKFTAMEQALRRLDQQSLPDCSRDFRFRETGIQPSLNVNAKQSAPISLRDYDHEAIDPVDHSGARKRN